MLRVIELLKKEDLKAPVVTFVPDNDEQMKNCSQYLFPAAMRKGGSEDDMKNELVKAQEDIENMVHEGVFFEQMHGEGDPYPERGNRIVMEVDVPMVDALTEEEDVEVKWINDGACQVDDEVYYENVRGRFVATTERGVRENVAVEVVIFDDDFVYPHKWKVGGGHLQYPEDPLSGACRFMKSEYGAPLKGMRRAGVIRDNLDGKRIVTYVYFAPIEMNAQLELKRVSLANRKNYQVFLLDQCCSLINLKEQWTQCQDIKYKVVGALRPRNSFSQQLKKGGGVANFLMRKKGKYFDVHMKVLLWLKDGCGHGYMTDRCSCTVRVVGQRQFLGFSFQSSLIKGWVKCFINHVNDSYWVDDERVRRKGQQKLRAQMRQQFRDRFRIEWALGGVIGKTGWVGLDVVGGEKFPRYARLRDPRKEIGVGSETVISPEGDVTSHEFQYEK